MKILDKHVDIDNPVEVWDYINKNYHDNGKKIFWNYYLMYAKCKNLNVENLRFEPVKKVPFIPSEDMLDNLINRCKGRKGRNTLKILKTLGCRVGELKNLRFDSNRRVAIVKIEKRKKIWKGLSLYQIGLKSQKNGITDIDIIQRLVKKIVQKDWCKKPETWII